MGPQAAPSASPSPPRTPLQRAGRLAAIGGVLAALLALGAPLCPIAAVTRQPCPGCGLTRATIALGHGHVAEAFRIHPLAPIVAPLMGGFVAYACAAYLATGRWPGAAGRSASVVAALGIALWTLLLAVWLARFHGAFGGPVPV